MEAILKFNLPEEQSDFDLAVNGAKAQSALCGMDQWLRSQTKYAPDDMSEDTFKAFELCREQLREIVYENGLIFE
jgi:hypothetical protein